MTPVPLSAPLFCSLFCSALMFLRPFRTAGKLEGAFVSQGRAAPNPGLGSVTPLGFGMWEGIPSGKRARHGGSEYNLGLIGLLAPILIAGPGCLAVGNYLPLPMSRTTGRVIAGL